MAESEQSPEARRRLDELRQRLYRDGASAEDLRRYAALEAALRDPEPAESEAAQEPGALQEAEAPQESDERAPRRTRPLLGAAVVVAVLAAATVGVASSGLLAHRSTPDAARAARAVEDIGDGQTLVLTKSIAAPTRVATTVDGTPTTGQRFHGVGDAVVPLDRSAAPFDGGVASVAISAAEASPVAWRALGLSTRRDWTSYLRVVARGTVDARPGALAPTTFAYTGDPPTRIVVQCPAGLHWTLQVAFLPAVPAPSAESTDRSSLH